MSLIQTMCNAASPENDSRRPPRSSKAQSATARLLLADVINVAADPELRGDAVVHRSHSLRLKWPTDSATPQGIVPLSLLPDTIQSEQGNLPNLDSEYSQRAVNQRNRQDENHVTSPKMKRVTTIRLDSPPPTPRPKMRRLCQWSESQQLPLLPILLCSGQL
jgi:hypothetical protein